MQPQEQPVIRTGGLEIRYPIDGIEACTGSGAEYFRDIAATVPGGPGPGRRVAVMARYGLTPERPATS